jgi:hypothetical protein
VERAPTAKKVLPQQQRINDARALKTAKRAHVRLINSRAVVKSNAAQKANKENAAKERDAAAASPPAATPNAAAAADSPPSDDAPPPSDDAPVQRTRTPFQRRTTEFLTFEPLDPDKAFAMGQAKCTPPAASDTLGHGYIDEKALSEDIIEFVKAGCSTCASRNFHFQKDRRRGVGGALVFMCNDCGFEHEIRRGYTHTAAGGKKGAHYEENTLRLVTAFKCAGINHTQANHVLLGAGIPSLSNDAWNGPSDKVNAAIASETAKMCAANLEEEKAATIALLGEKALAPDGSVFITVLGDGSWSKRYGRNSLAGIFGFYGALTNKCIYAGSRIARCAVCTSAVRNGDDGVREHECTKNWDERDGADGAASNMEKSIAVEGVNAVFAQGAIVAVRARARVCARRALRSSQTNYTLIIFYRRPRAMRHTPTPMA